MFIVVFLIDLSPKVSDIYLYTFLLKVYNTSVLNEIDPLKISKACPFFGALKKQKLIRLNTFLNLYVLFLFLIALWMS